MPNLPRFRSVADLLGVDRPSDPVHCIRPAIIEAAARTLLREFPGAVAYAVKANPLPIVLETLFQAGVRHFDTASPAEIRLVRGMFGDQATLYYNNPAKSRDAIREAYGVGVRRFSADCAAEIDKIRDVLPADEAVVIAVRMMTPPGTAVFNLSRKFGADPADVPALLKRVRDHGFKPALCFHVGSQCVEPAMFDRAFQLTNRVIEEAGVALDHLNVGGGFPTAYAGEKVPPLRAFIRAIKLGRPDLPLVCEPGRALVAEGNSVLTQVTLRKANALYINDGVFGSFMEIPYGKDRLMLPARPIRPGKGFRSRTKSYTIYGPTCDGNDVLPYQVRLPEDMREGDYIEFDRIGAYGICMATTFNGFTPSAVVVIEDADAVELPTPMVMAEVA
ncbi:MAG: type III PLP-dependent enzyme [Proteobacteria bacterium]|nr:type III PLP-dependent enzyme [Pseudomonadota bacterium]MBI3496863.1 type III PLP-dependent enzyme [Pseudomonadota bacterium]